MKLSLTVEVGSRCVDQVVANLSYYTVGALCEAGDRKHVGCISIAVVCRTLIVTAVSSLVVALSLTAIAASSTP